MYVDGVENEMVSMVETTWVFESGGIFIQQRSNQENVSSSWELIDEEYLRVAASVFKIRSLSNKILTLETGEDIMYFIPED